MIGVNFTNIFLMCPYRPMPGTIEHLRTSDIWLIITVVNTVRSKFPVRIFSLYVNSILKRISDSPPLLLQGLFVVLGVGLILATTVFVLELFVPPVAKKNTLIVCDPFRR